MEIYTGEGVKKLKTKNTIDVWKAKKWTNKQN